MFSRIIYDSLGFPKVYLRFIEFLTVLFKVLWVSLRIQMVPYGLQGSLKFFMVLYGSSGLPRFSLGSLGFLRILV